MFTPITPKNIHTVESLVETLFSKYGRIQEGEWRVREIARTLESSFTNLEKISGLKFLDIGCGAISGTADTKIGRGPYEPWFLRAIKELGGRGVGIDLGFVSQKDQQAFEFLRRDLSINGVLDDLSTASFDAIHCANLFSSPHLVYLMRKDKLFRSRMKDEILHQVRRLLKPNGKIIHFDHQLDNH
jgi:SAM-dependent methyltransferase